MKERNELRALIRETCRAISKGDTPDLSGYIWEQVKRQLEDADIKALRIAEGKNRARRDARLCLARVKELEAMQQDIAENFEAALACRDPEEAAAREKIRAILRGTTETEEGA